MGPYSVYASARGAIGAALHVLVHLVIAELSHQMSMWAEAFLDQSSFVDLAFSSQFSSVPSSCNEIRRKRMQQSQWWPDFLLSGPVPRSIWTSSRAARPGPPAAACSDHEGVCVLYNISACTELSSQLLQFLITLDLLDDGGTICNRPY